MVSAIVVELPSSDEEEEKVPEVKSKASKGINTFWDLCPWFVIRKAICYVPNLQILHNIYLFSSSCHCPLLAVSVLYFEKNRNM